MPLHVPAPTTFFPEIASTDAKQLQNNTQEMLRGLHKANAVTSKRQFNNF